MNNGQLSEDCAKNLIMRGKINLEIYSIIEYEMRALEKVTQIISMTELCYTKRSDEHFSDLS